MSSGGFASLILRIHKTGVGSTIVLVLFAGNLNRVSCGWLDGMSGLPGSGSE